MRAYVGSIVVGLSLPLAGAAQAQVIPGNNQPPNVPAAQLEAKKAEAIQKGAAWLASKQEADGSWSYPNAPVQHVYWPMKQGVTALCATALLKTGTDPQSDGIKRAFEFMDKAEMKWTYAVACVLLACEARASWAPPPRPAPTATGPWSARSPRPSRPRRTWRWPGRRSPSCWPTSPRRGCGATPARAAARRT